MSRRKQQLATPSVQRIAVRLTVPEPEPQRVTVSLSAPVPTGRPRAVVANAYDGKRLEPRQPGELVNDIDLGAQAHRLYLCADCGQEGTLGIEWLRVASFEGDVLCPTCGKVMAPREWPKRPLA